MGTGTQVNPGKDAAWLEIDLDPRRTMITGEVSRDTNESVYEESNGLNSKDEEVNHIYLKPILKKSTYSSNLTATSQNFRPANSRARVLEESIELRNGTNIQDVDGSGSKKGANLNLKLENFRAKLEEYKLREGISIHDCEEEQTFKAEEQNQQPNDAPLSARFGFVHTQIPESLSDKYLILNHRKMKIPSNNTSIISDYSNTFQNKLGSQKNISSNENILKPPKHPFDTKDLDFLHENEQGTSSPNPKFRRIIRKSDYSQEKKERFEEYQDSDIIHEVSEETDVNTNTNQYQTNYDNVGIKQMSVSTFGPRDRMQNSRKESKDISQLNEIGTGMSFYQKLKEKKLSVNSEAN